MDYSSPRREIGYEAYAKEIARASRWIGCGMEWKTEAPLKMAERTLQVGYRVPDEKRLAWAQEMVTKLGDNIPNTQPEIYAIETLQLHDRQRTELKLQALRIGEFGVTAIPNEVFAITGLKLKRQSPFAQTMNVELANGAEGYIPPPEQHALGGYTTWPARTAGLESQAEPRIVAALLGLLEEVAEEAAPTAGGCADCVFQSGARSEAGRVLATRRHERADCARCNGPARRVHRRRSRALSPWRRRREIGPLRRRSHPAKLALGDHYTVSFWLWNALPYDARAVTGYAFSRGPDGDPKAPAEHLGIGGTFRADPRRKAHSV